MSPGELLLRPAPWLAALLMVFNDAVLKVHHPGWVSGKLSGFAACFLAPVALVSAWAWVGGRRRPQGVFTACALTGAWYAAIEVLPDAARLHGLLLGWLFPFASFRATPDLTDLLALPMVAVAGCWMRREGADGVRICEVRYRQTGRGRAWPSERNQARFE